MLNNETLDFSDGAIVIASSIFGKGGNINEGQGSNVQIQTQSFLLFSGSEIAASSESDINRAIGIQTQFDLNCGLETLSANLFDASHQIAQRCVDEVTTRNIGTAVNRCECDLAFVLPGSPDSQSDSWGLNVHKHSLTIW